MGRSNRRWQLWRRGQSLSHSRVGKRVRSVKFERYGLLLSQLRLSLYHLISCTEVAPTRCFFLPPLVELCYFHDVISCGFTQDSQPLDVVTPEKGSVSGVQQVHQHDGFFQNGITVYSHSCMSLSRMQGRA